MKTGERVYTPRFRIVTESGKQLFNKTYSEATAERIWGEYNGVYTDDDGNEERIYIEEVEG